MTSMASEPTNVPATTSDASRDLYRVILLRRGIEMLVLKDESTFELPSVQIPKRQRVTENLIACMKAKYGIDAICLFNPVLSSPMEPEKDEALYYVMETRDGDSLPVHGFVWVRMTPPFGRLLADPSDRNAVLRTISGLRDYRTKQEFGPFAIPGWMPELLRWAQKQIDSSGLHLTGLFRQFASGPAFSLLQLETDGPRIWFKAVGQPNLHELPISDCLAKLFSHFVPRVIAIHKEWNGWLMTDSVGPTLDQIEHGFGWERAARNLAELQIASLNTSGRLFEAGCRDLRAQTLSAQIDHFVEAGFELMSCQNTPMPRRLTLGEVQELGATINQSLEDWTRLAIPDTLGHSDFNPGNIIYGRSRCTFLDWAEAYVGAPWWTVEYLLAHLRQNRPNDTETENRVATAYAKAWGSLLSPETIAKARSLAPLIAVYAYAGGPKEWVEAIASPNSHSARYFCSLVRRMQRMAYLSSETSPAKPNEIH